MFLDAITKLAEIFEEKKIILCGINVNFVTKIWKEEEEKIEGIWEGKKDPVIIHDVLYTGMSVKEKLNWIQKDVLHKNKCHALVVTTLDDIACNKFHVFKYSFNFRDFEYERK